MHCCGIDPSFENTALVVLGESLDVVKVSESHQVKELRRAEPGVVRLRLFYDWLRMELSTLPGGVHMWAGYEDYAYGSMHKGETMGELGGALKLALAHSGGHKIALVAPTEVKLFAVGNGQATKEALYEKALEESAGAIEGHKKDASDAYFIAKLAAYCALGANVVDPYITRDRVRVALNVVERNLLSLC